MIEQENPHHKKRPFSCNQCDKSFKINAHLTRHQKIHTDKKPFKCLQCGIYFREQSQLKKHRKIHTDEKPFKCLQCGRYFREQSTLKRHKNSHTFQKTYSCFRCDKIFVNMQLLNEHTKLHGDIACKECKTTFTEEGSLKRHIRVHTGEKPYSCAQCPESFRLTNHRDRHQAEHSGNLLYKCDLCHASLISASGLRRHKTTHSTETPFSCYQCGKSFKSAHLVTSHKRTHDGAKPYKCKHCEKYFARSSNRRGHERRHGISSDNKKPFLIRCLDCDKGFPDHSNLKRHQATHSNERPFQCNQCGKAFKFKDDMKRHQLIHNEERNYPCGECEKRFKQASALYGHIRIVHRGVGPKPKIKKGKSRKSSKAQRRPQKCSQCELFSCKEHTEVNTTLIKDEARKVKRHKKYLQVKMDVRKFLPCSQCGDKPYSCKQCDERFARDANLLNHHATAHPEHRDEKEIFQCHRCRVSFSKAEYFRRHHTREIQNKRKIIYTKNKENFLNCSKCGEKPYSCKQCGIRFVKAPELVEHQTKSHGSADGKKVFECNHCEKSFTQAGYFRQHHKKHTEGKMQNFVNDYTKMKSCDQCGKNPYSCNHCQDRFAGSKELMKHIKTLHQQIAERDFPCNHCKRSFSKAKHFLKHHRIHIKGTFHCKICDKDLTLSPPMMREHKKEHVDEKQYQSHLCEEKIIDQGLLESHQDFHLKLPLLLNCEQCDDKFKDNEELQRHMGNHSRLRRMWQYDL